MALDKEVQAISSIKKTLDGLELRARRRVITYVLNWIRDSEEEAQEVLLEEPPPRVARAIIDCDESQPVTVESVVHPN